METGVSISFYVIRCCLEASRGIRRHASLPLREEVRAAWSRPLPPTPGGTSPVGSPHRTSVGDADDFRAPLRLSEGVGGGKKYEQSLGRVADIAFIGLGSPLRYGGLRTAFSAVHTLVLFLLRSFWTG